MHKLNKGIVDASQSQHLCLQSKSRIDQCTIRIYWYCSLTCINSRVTIYSRFLNKQQYKKETSPLTHHCGLNVVAQKLYVACLELLHCITACSCIVTVSSCVVTVYSRMVSICSEW